MKKTTNTTIMTTTEIKKSTSIRVLILLTLFAQLLFSSCEMEAPEIEQELTGDPLSEGLPETSSAIQTSSSTVACGVCDHVVNSYITDGDILNIQPGDIICLDAAKNYSRLVFRNIVGTSAEPVIIRNCGGVAKIYSDASFGLKFEDSKHFNLVGDGSPDPYGIKVSTEKGFFVTMEHFTTNFEVSRIEVAGPTPFGLGDHAGFAGIGVKTSPYQDCDLFTDPTRKAWIMYDVKIHHNYIHDTGGEGIYMGHGFYKGRQESQCPSMTYSHSIKGVRIYENLIENVGFDGIQIKNADKDVLVYKNIVRNYGTNGETPHNEGLFIGEGTTGKFYDNIIDTGTGNGCQVQGIGNLRIYNNQFLNSGDHGIYACHGDYVVRWGTGYFDFYNNTIFNSGTTGFVFYNDEGGPKRFYNNLVVLAGTLTKSGAQVDMKNNILTNNAISVGFAGLLNSDLHLGTGSMAIDAGLDLITYGVKTDCEGVSRPSGGAFDIGAYEKR